MLVPGSPSAETVFRPSGPPPRLLLRTRVWKPPAPTSPSLQRAFSRARTRAAFLVRFPPGHAHFPAEDPPSAV